MERSETIGKLAEALAKAQGQITGARKDSENPFFKSKYSDLASVWDAIRPALSANGLSVVQTPYMAPDGTVGLTTILMHASGEYIQGNMCMKPLKPDPQSLGSVISYLRRYCISAYTGVAQVDDDGNAASEGAQTHSKATTTKVYEMKPGQPKDVEAGLGEEPSASTIEEEAAKTDLRNKIKGAARGITKKDDFLTFCGGMVKSVDQLQEVLDNIEKWKMDFINSQAKEIKR